MERNQITGLVLMAVLLIGYFYFFPSTTEAPQSDNVVTTTTGTSGSDTLATMVSPQQPAGIDSTRNDSVHQAMLASQYGVFAPAAEGEDKTIHIASDVLEVDFTTHGGRIVETMLPGFVTAFKKPLVLRDDRSMEESYWVQAGNVRVDLWDLYYTTNASNVQLSEGDTTQVVFTADLGQGRVVKQVYTLAYGSHVVAHRLYLEGLQPFLGQSAQYQVLNNMRHQEEVVTTSRSDATVMWYTADGSSDELSERSTSLEQETAEEPIKWVNMKQKFFSQAIIADGAFRSGEFSTSVPNENDTTSVKQATLLLTANLDSAFTTAGLGYRYYFGPNDYNILRKVEPGLRGTVYLGWPPVKWVNRFLIIPVFELLETFIGSYGVIIILLVVFIKMLLLPLSYRSYTSMAKMRVMKPEIDEIKERFPDDMQKQQQETMALYRQVGVNPISGCIPVVLQMPVLFAMFYFFPGSIELRQEAWLWAHDLSTYDTLISWSSPIPLLGTHLSLFTVLMTISTILYTWSNNQMSTVQGPMKTVTYIMPVVFLFVLNDFPAALTFYYFVSNLVTFGQQALIRRFVDEDKLRSILDENRLKNKDKKKSKFQSRLEEAMKASEQAQKDRASRKGGNSGKKRK